MTLRLLLAVSVLCAAAHTAAAQSEDKAAAEAAFQQAKELRDAGKLAEACPQFAKSQQLDPQLGTQYNLALCYEATGRLASAWGELSEVAAKDTNVRRRDDARRRVAALTPRLTHMLITVPARLDGLTVARDGVDITRLVGIDTPVDPGVYTVEVAAPGHAPWQTKVDLTAEGATVTIEVPRLTPRPEAVVAPHGDEPGAAAIATPPPTTPGPRRRGRVIAGLALAGGGVVATGVGVVLGVQYLGLRDDARTACGGSVAACTGDLDAAERYTARARTVGLRSSVLLGVGAVAIGAGVVVWLTAPRRGGGERRTALVPTVDGEHAGLTLLGRF